MKKKNGRKDETVGGRGGACLAEDEKGGAPMGGREGERVRLSGGVKVGEARWEDGGRRAKNKVEIVGVSKKGKRGARTGDDREGRREEGLGGGPMQAAPSWTGSTGGHPPNPDLSRGQRLLLFDVGATMSRNRAREKSQFRSEILPAAELRILEQRPRGQKI